MATKKSKVTTTETPVVVQNEPRTKGERILQKYNDYHRVELSSIQKGTELTPQKIQIIVLKSVIDAFRSEYLNSDNVYNEISISDIELLIEELEKQSDFILKRVKEQQGKVWVA